ncbi:protoporphyrinogen oxidase [Deinococcus radiophilus]|uniref:Coproporphyrinogen III oxidase n=1 Tax=Deinococcus radiophilus TaxID=32062 RepID=A0A3S0KDA0_9DEIO|nr:protoporphyrinogen oxidase [Deinococcus radiophilus]RTR27999.1 protoporphyrinogen oxidase [Deinococcus radiophilus]UFA51554.1 protoporphyrinogen oxidase [Deinococcus radiophilus]
MTDISESLSAAPQVGLTQGGDRRGAATTDQPVIVVGGGLTGLSAAWELQQLGLPYVLLEAGDYLGGKVQTEWHSLPGAGDFLVEKAADAFILGKPWALELAREVGLESELIHPREDTKRLYFLKGGRLLPFPEHLRMFVPLDEQAFRRSGVLSPEGTERMLGEVNVPPRENADEDESLASFVTRRFGEEAMNFIVPMAAGIYVANPHELSMQMAFPQFLAMEQKYGSLIAAHRALPPRTGPIFGSFRGGMGELAGAVGRALTEEVRLNSAVRQVHRDGVTLASGEHIAGRGVIMTTPAWFTAPLLAGDFPEAAALVGQLKTNSSVAVILAYRREQFAFDMDMHGLQVDWSEGIAMTAITVHSGKMHGRAPEDHVLLRVFFKNTEPGEARRLAEGYVRELFGAEGEPLFHAFADWRGKNPAYVVGHRHHLAAIRAALPGTVQVAGASFTGVGLPDCVNAGRTAARQVMTSLAE